MIAKRSWLDKPMAHFDQPEVMGPSEPSLGTIRAQIRAVNLGNISMVLNSEPSLGTIRAQIRGLAHGVGDATKNVLHQVEGVRREITALRSEIEALRSEVAALRREIAETREDRQG
jgi:uncharacterized protein (DUF3084 family)